VDIAAPGDSFGAPTAEIGEAPDLSVPAASAREPEPGFDLAAELNDAFDDDSNSGTISGLGDSADGFAAVFSEFKKGVSQMLSASDHEAHYDLGIAYREMGLFEDAKGEFRAAMLSPASEIQSRHMLGLCFLEQGEFDNAVVEFEAIVGSESANDEQILTARFELGRSWEALGDLESARGAYKAVAAVDPEFCDVGVRLAALDDPEKPDEPAVEDEGLESFDDWLADDEAATVEDEPATSEYESFEGFIEAEEDSQPAAPAVEAELDPEPEHVSQPELELVPEPEPEPAPEPPRRKKRKKISFV
jgi:tetratricopeptide (TPR) repeat protein